ncbi:SnoaL-like domain protein [compost metagenome]
MSEDCVFETVGGPDACGSRHAGTDAVRAAFAAAWKNFPDAQWNNGRHWVAGDRGVSECTFTGTAADGSRVEADMVDIFTFQDGKIRVKNAFRKQRPALPARA